jgi:hypothetical protein
MLCAAAGRYRGGKAQQPAEDRLRF